MAPIRFVIGSPEAYERARERMSEIIDASVDGQTPLEAELTALTEACMDWEHATDIGSEASGSIDQTSPIASEVEYHAAKARMASILASGDRSGKLTEIANVSEALEAWELQNVPKTGKLEE